ncbi:hypothetical protein [Caproiciproducens sp.]|uniref:hypothetical protein n=1 Tax=Caproiciproducens sp. TaxID=1954376 RepID=UPI0028981844|nr:hypothetical protein [Caproiciproducens sp.]
MVDAVSIIGAFLGGCVGALVGGNPAFVIAGIVGVIFLSMGNVPAALVLQKTVEWTLFTPCICFAGAVAALAFAANKRKYDVVGTNLNKALGFTQDPLTVLVGGIFGLFGFMCLSTFVYLKLPLDAGALTVMLSGFIVRLLFGHHKIVNPKLNEVSLYHKGCAVQWTYKILVGLVVAAAAAYAVHLTGIATTGFYISALSLIFFLRDGDFPVTHHVTLIAGYATVRSGSVLIGILFGVLACIVFELYQNTINTNVDSHIDAPASTIATLSLVIFSIFPA